MTAPSEQHPPPRQEQDYPGHTAAMDPRPRDEMRGYEGSGVLAGQRALVTGGDSGIGRAVAVAFAKEGGDVAITYLSEQEDEDARHTAELVAKTGQRCVTIRADLAQEANCERVVNQTVHELGGLDILQPHRQAGRLSPSQPADPPAVTGERLSTPWLLAPAEPASRVIAHLVSWPVHRGPSSNDRADHAFGRSCTAPPASWVRSRHCACAGPRPHPPYPARSGSLQAGGQQSSC